MKWRQLGHYKKDWTENRPKKEYRGKTQLRRMCMWIYCAASSAYSWILAAEHQKVVKFWAFMLNATCCSITLGQMHFVYALPLSCFLAETCANHEKKQKNARLGCKVEHALTHMWLTHTNTHTTPLYQRGIDIDEFVHVCSALQGVSQYTHKYQNHPKPIEGNAIPHAGVDRIVVQSMSVEQWLLGSPPPGVRLALATRRA